MKKLISIVALLSLSQLAHAQLFSKPSLHAVKGHIETNDPEIDLSQLKIEQGLYCTKGWGDGQRSCGKKVVEAKVNAKGDFELPGVKGERDGNWSSTSYAVYYGDKILFRNPFTLRAHDDKETIKKLLSNFTIYKLHPFKVNFTTDTGITFEQWMSEWNKNSAVGIWLSVKSSSTTDAVGRILPDQRYLKAHEENKSTVEMVPQMIPGTLANVIANSTVHYQIQSRYLGNYESKMIAEKTLKLSDETLFEKLSNVELQTKLIDYKIDGIWRVGVHISFHEGNHYFQYEDPALIIESKCEDGILKGKLRLDYRKLTHMNEIRDLTGTCALGKAEFDVKVTATNYSQENDLRNFDLKVRIWDIAADSGKAHVVDLATGKVYTSYGGADRCKSLSDGQYGTVCDR